MSFVIYDVETTGLLRGFDQIVQFAAVMTDSDLQIQDRFSTRCRLMPHVVPSSEALLITDTEIEELTDPSLPSHYWMVAEIRKVLEGWSPALFLGFNSLSFDEEFLRQAFYQSLYIPFLTNTQGNARADVLNLCRVTAALRRDVLIPATNDHGLPSFKLKALCEANGIAVSHHHEAMADVETTLTLCRHIKAKAPEIWSQFLRFSKKSSVEAFISDEDAFLVSETIGNQHRARLVTRIGRHSAQPNRHYCLDLHANLRALREMTHEELVDVCKASVRPIVTLRSNAAPTLWATYDAPEHIAPLDEQDVADFLTDLRQDRDFLTRLCKAAQAAEKNYPPSSHIEGKIYEGSFPSDDDRELMSRFHTSKWEERTDIGKSIEDERYRRLSMRVIFFEQPHLLDERLREAAGHEMQKRLLAPVHAEQPWRSIPAAIMEAQTLIAEAIDDRTRDIHVRYLKHLQKRMGEL